MKSFDDAYLSNIVIPHRLITTVRQIGEYKGRQDLYKQQAPEMLEKGVMMQLMSVITG